MSVNIYDFVKLRLKQVSLSALTQIWDYANFSILPIGKRENLEENEVWPFCRLGQYFTSVSTASFSPVFGVYHGGI